MVIRVGFDRHIGEGNRDDTEVMGKFNVKEKDHGRKNACRF